MDKFYSLPRDYVTSKWVGGARGESKWIDHIRAVQLEYNNTHSNKLDWKRAIALAKDTYTKEEPTKRSSRANLPVPPETAAAYLASIPKVTRRPRRPRKSSAVATEDAVTRIESAAAIIESAAAPLLAIAAPIIESAAAPITESAAAPKRKSRKPKYKPLDPDWSTRHLKELPLMLEKQRALARKLSEIPPNPYLESIPKFVKKTRKRRNKQPKPLAPDWYLKEPALERQRALARELSANPPNPDLESIPKVVKKTRPAPPGTHPYDEFIKKYAAEHGVTYEQAVVPASVLFHSITGID